MCTAIDFVLFDSLQMLYAIFAIYAISVCTLWNFGWKHNESVWIKIHSCLYIYGRKLIIFGVIWPQKHWNHLPSFSLYCQNYPKVYQYQRNGTGLNKSKHTCTLTLHTIWLKVKMIKTNSLVNSSGTNTQASHPNESNLMSKMSQPNSLICN